ASPIELPLAEATPAAAASLPHRVPRRVSRAWSRRLVPALAFVVLATLAGTSVLLDDDSAAPRPQSSGSATAGDSAVPNATSGAGSDEVASGGAAAPVEGEVSAPDANTDVTAAAGGAIAEAARDASAGTSTGAGPAAATGDPASGSSAKSATVPDPALQGAEGDGTATPPAGYDDLIEPGDTSICVIAFDDAILPNLPGGRIAMLVRPGPFGLVLVCG
ncbi:MAG: hypothetical protein JWM86_1975, partial [Thermoleophilia bacterium]|nr:hypothetical protein [Thermoleophilia bacterium]